MSYAEGKSDEGQSLFYIISIAGMVLLAFDKFKAVFLSDLRVFLVINFAHEHLQRTAVNAIIAVESPVYYHLLVSFCVQDRALDNFIEFVLEMAVDFTVPGEAA